MLSLKNTTMYLYLININIIKKNSEIARAQKYVAGLVFNIYKSIYKYL